MTKLTAAQRKRLDKLATYLEGLPKRYRHFDMGDFLYGSDPEGEAHYARKNGGVASCGTVACAVGHGPAAGVLVPPRLVVGRKWPWTAVDWDKYAELFVGGIPDGFSWCFAGSWRGNDNHHWGAAARIRYLLDHGAPPERFQYPTSHWRKVYAPYRVDAKVAA